MESRPPRGAYTNVLNVYTPQIALDSNGEASGDLYLDDSHSFEYQEGAYVHRKFSFKGGVLTSTKYADQSAYAVKVCKCFVLFDCRKEF